MKQKIILNSPCSGESPADTVQPAAVSGFAFEAGEIYLLHESDPQCPAESSLWATFGSRDAAGIMLEACTDNLIDFRRWCRLPSGYRCCRLATTEELRDYMTALAMFEMQCDPCG